MPLDVRVDVLANQRHAGGVPDEAKDRAFDDAGIHGGAPLGGQAEPEDWLAPKRAVTADTTVARPRRQGLTGTKSEPVVRHHQQKLALPPLLPGRIGLITGRSSDVGKDAMRNAVLRGRQLSLKSGK